MNKIERAIYDVRLLIQDREHKLLVADTELKSLNQQLKTLLIIEEDESIPHETFKN
jgi:hypothetical protein